MNARYILQAIAFMLILSTAALFDAYPVPCFIAVGIAAVLTGISNIGYKDVRCERRSIKVDRRIYRK